MHETKKQQHPLGNVNMTKCSVSPLNTFTYIQPFVKKRLVLTCWGNYDQNARNAMDIRIAPSRSNWYNNYIIGSSTPTFVHICIIWLNVRDLTDDRGTKYWSGLRKEWRPAKKQTITSFRHKLYMWAYVCIFICRKLDIDGQGSTDVILSMWLIKSEFE